MSWGRAISFCLGGLLVLACAMPARPAQLQIELPAQARLAPGPLRLGELARLHADDLSLMRALVDLPIGQLPASGAALRLDRERLAAWIARRLPEAADSVHWRGAATSWVLAAQRRVPGEQIAAVAAEALREWIARQGARAELASAASPRDVQAPEGGPLRLVARPLDGQPLRRRMVVWVELWSGEAFVRSVPVPFSVGAWRESLALRASLPAGAAVTADALTRREMDLVAERAAVLPAASAQASGEVLAPSTPLRTRHALAAGQPLHAADLAPQREVTRGDWATLRTGAGPVLAQARVEVLQDGRTGEMVRVRAPGAPVSLAARVLGPGLLEVAP